MKRRIIGLILISSLICLFSFNLNEVDGSYGVIIGETYDYELILARQNLTYGNNYASCKGIYSWDYLFNEGDLITYEITNVNDLLAEFNITSESFRISTMTCADYDLNMILSFSMQALFLTMSYKLDPWNQTIWERGIYMPYISPFLEISNTTWDELKDLDQHMTNICNDIVGTKTLIQQFSAFQTNGLLEIETYIKGDILGSLWGDDNVEISMINQLKFAFNTEIGVLQGLHVKSWLSGDYVDYDDLEISYEFHIELVGYDLQDFLFSDTRVVGNIGELTIIGTITFTFIVILIKYKKKNRNY